MTTKVTIRNHGPNSVQPKIMERVKGAPDRWWESKFRGNHIAPGETADFYVHGSQKIEIVELAADNLTETKPQ